MDLKLTSNSRNVSSTSKAYQFRETYKPEKGEEYCAYYLDRMYAGDAPTMNDARCLYGDNVINLWLSEQIAYMFELTDISMGIDKINSLIRLIRAKYHFLKVTEFMHYVYLFRSGEFGKIYGKADGQLVMLTLKDYMKMRDDIKEDIRRRTERGSRELMGETLGESRNAQSDTVKAMVNTMLSDEFLKYGEWRNEPWGQLLSRWFFCYMLPQIQQEGKSKGHTVSEIVDAEQRYFPGNWSYEHRRDKAIELGWVERPRRIILEIESL